MIYQMRPHLDGLEAEVRELRERLAVALALNDRARVAMGPFRPFSRAIASLLADLGPGEAVEAERQRDDATK